MEGVPRGGESGTRVGQSAVDAQISGPVIMSGITVLTVSIIHDHQTVSSASGTSLRTQNVSIAVVEMDLAAQAPILRSAPLMGSPASRTTSGTQYPGRTPRLSWWDPWSDDRLCWWRWSATTRITHSMFLSLDKV